MVGKVGGIPHYKLSHPSQVTKDGALPLIPDIQNGDEIIRMTGSRDSLVTRAGRSFESGLIIGAIVVYCGGVMHTIKEEMDLVAEVIDQAIGRVPFPGRFTFGERGCFIDNENIHGILMISLVAFSRAPTWIPPGTWTNWKVRPGAWQYSLKRWVQGLER